MDRPSVLSNGALLGLTLTSQHGSQLGQASSSLDIAVFNSPAPLKLVSWIELQILVHSKGCFTPLLPPFESSHANTFLVLRDLLCLGTSQSAHRVVIPRLSSVLHISAQVSFALLVSGCTCFRTVILVSDFTHSTIATLLHGCMHLGALMSVSFCGQASTMLVLQTLARVRLVLLCWGHIRSRRPAVVPDSLCPSLLTLLQSSVHSISSTLFPNHASSGSSLPAQAFTRITPSALLFSMSRLGNLSTSCGFYLPGLLPPLHGPTCLRFFMFLADLSTFTAPLFVHGCVKLDASLAVTGIL